MAIALGLLALNLYLRTVTAWDYTEYLIIAPTVGIDRQTTIGTVTVTPTGSVSPITTSISIFETKIEFGSYNGYGKFNVTVTDLFLDPKASVCRADNLQFTCSATPPTTMHAQTIQTSMWAPVTISNPSSCTQTSFTYTTSIKGTALNLPGLTAFPGILSQATQTGPNGEALFITTYISTISVDLGGQAVTTSRCDIWLLNFWR